MSRPFTLLRLVTLTMSIEANKFYYYKIIHIKVKVKGEVLPVLFLTAPRHEGVMGEWKYSLGTRWR